VAGRAVIQKGRGSKLFKLLPHQEKLKMLVRVTPKLTTYGEDRSHTNKCNAVTEPHPENSVTELLFLVILQENPKVRTDLIRAVFRACDTNGDDWLGETEFRTIVGAPYGVVF
jgi:hypothetical protein